MSPVLAFALAALGAALLVAVMRNRYLARSLLGSHVFHDKPRHEIFAVIILLGVIHFLWWYRSERMYLFAAKHLWFWLAQVGFFIAVMKNGMDWLKKFVYSSMALSIAWGVVTTFRDSCVLGSGESCPLPASMNVAGEVTRINTAAAMEGERVKRRCADYPYEKPCLTSDTTKFEHLFRTGQPLALPVYNMYRVTMDYKGKCGDILRTVADSGETDWVTYRLRPGLDTLSVRFKIYRIYFSSPKLHRRC